MNINLATECKSISKKPILVYAVHAHKLVCMCTCVCRDIGYRQHEHYEMERWKFVQYKQTPDGLYVRKKVFYLHRKITCMVCSSALAQIAESSLQVSQYLHHLTASMFMFFPPSFPDHFQYLVL